MPSNSASWLVASKQRPLETKEAPYTKPGEGQLVVKVKAVAMNPIDRMKQELGNLLYGHIKYPFTLGYDLAGEVVEVGPGVTDFEVGARVLALAVGLEKDVNRSAEGAFQHYAITRAYNTCIIPDHLSFEQACVVPLGLATAATGLFKKDRLGLNLPTSPHNASTGKTVLIWGGSTSVGVNAIQLAVAAGYDVITTCSPRNFEFVKQLGATLAYDYNSNTVTQDIIQAFDGRDCAGALAIGGGSADKCMDILYKCKGSRFIASASFPLPEPLPTGAFAVPRIGAAFISWAVANTFKSTVRSSKTVFYTATEIVLDHEVGQYIFGKFLPNALARGDFKCAPQAEVVGTGLEYIQEAFDALGKGVSAKKLVVSL